MKPFKHSIYLLLLASLVICSGRKEIYQVKIFDAHLHFKKDIAAQVKQFENHNIVGGAISGSWISGENYRTGINQKLLFGLMLPCPGGIVPYGGPKCFADGEEFPDINWVRDQILKHKIDFFGELLNEYYGISLSDSSMFPYYALAQELKIPIGIHTGLAGPNHGCPNYNPSMGDPELMRGFLKKFPGLKVWIMHAGAPYLKGTLGILKDYPSVYVDISVISDPDIVTKNDFHSYMKLLVEAGFEDRLMFGSDGGDFSKIIPTINELDFLNTQQKEKIFYKNAQRFFGL